jgi:hypothetical protein
MTFDGWINYQDPLVLGHVPLLETVSLTNTGYSFHNLVKLSEFLCGTSIRDLKLGFKSEKVSQDYRFPSCGFTYSLLISIMCLFFAGLGAARISDQKSGICVPPTKVCESG